MTVASLRAERLPRLDHLEGHLTNPTHRETLRLALEPLTYEEIGQRLNVHWRTVAHRLETVYDAMTPTDGAGRLALRRLVLLRIAAAIDPCWCEL